MTLLAVGLMSGGVRFVFFLLAVMSFVAAAALHRTSYWPAFLAAGLAFAWIPTAWDAAAVA